MAPTTPDPGFEAMLAKTGIPLTPIQVASLYEGYKLLQPLLDSLRTPPRGRSAEPAHIFVAGPVA